MILDNYVYDVYDVRGTRVERHKWIHCFEASTAIIFVADISAYGQSIFENQSVNRVAEDLKLFEEICNSRLFDGTAIGLFFTKVDVLQRKLHTHSVKEIYTDFPGDETDIEVVKTYFRNKFLALDQHVGREIQVYYTSIADGDASVGDAAFDFIRNYTIS